MNATPIAPLVTSITVARLHNLGNYEHVRYEITVAVPDGAKPSEVLADLQAVLSDLAPSKVHHFHVREAKDALARPTPGPGAPEHEQRQDSQRRDEARATLARHDKEMQRIERARAALDDLGGARRYTDAKSRWDDEQP